jgi:hypothetical protein
MAMKIFCCVTLLFLLPLIGAQADARDDALAAMLRCGALADNGARLACFDSVVRQAGAAMATSAPATAAPPASMAAQSVPSAADAAPAAEEEQKTELEGFIGSMFADGALRSPQTSVQQFGSESIASRGEVSSAHHILGDKVDAISARVVAYSFLANGRLVLSLDNGQIWLQAAGDESIGSLSDPALSYTVQISRNSSSGSYDLHLSGHPHVMRFRRIR